jgi:type I restriction enzyme S subunit
MKRYENYKESGVDWVGDIPKDWSHTQLKYISSISKGRKAQEDYQDFKEGMIPYLSMEYLRSQTESPTYVIAEDSSIVLVDEKDLLILWDGSKAGEIVKAKYGALSSTMGKIHLESKSLDLNFLTYYLKNAELYIQANTVGMGIPHVSGEVLRTLFVTFPKLQEQTQVARYLDHQTGLIDEIIKGKEKLIELLKEKRQAVINEAVTKGLDPNANMKDSGIEWLGEIPKHWKIVKLKQVADTYGRIGYRGYTTEDIVLEGEGAITISPSNMKGDFMTFEDSTYISWAKYEESPEIQIYDNDVLMVKTGSTYGKVGLVKSLEKKATINPQILVFKNIQINPDYFYNILRTPFIQHQVETNVIGSTIPTISQAKILNFQLVLPPDNEINSILSFINTFMKRIDDLNIQLLSQIQKLKEYRQSLISEAVTGKLDVRDWMAPN